MDGIADASLLDLLLHTVEHILLRGGITPCAWHTHDEVHSHSAGVCEGLVHGCRIFHVYGAYGIACHTSRCKLLLECRYLLGIGIERQMEILDAEVVDINPLHEGKCCVEVELHESVACHTKMEGVRLGCFRRWGGFDCGVPVFLGRSGQPLEGRHQQCGSCYTAAKECSAFHHDKI